MQSHGKNYIDKCSSYMVCLRSMLPSCLSQSIDGASVDATIDLTTTG